MHNTLKTNLETKLETFLMGARFSNADQGSHAREQVQAEQKDKMMYQITRAITVELNILLKYDAELFGYDPNMYHFEMHEFLTERERINKEQRELALEKQKSDNLNDKAASYIQLIQSIAKMKFEGIDDNTIADIFDVDVALVTPIKAKDVEDQKVAKSPQVPEENNGV
jgi:hypothetical protein